LAAPNETIFKIIIQAHFFADFTYNYKLLKESRLLCTLEIIIKLQKILIQPLNVWLVPKDEKHDLLIPLLEASWSKFINFSD
jgi:hypothetical protein